MQGEAEHSLLHFSKYPTLKFDEIKYQNKNVPLLDGTKSEFINKGCLDLLDCYHAEIRYKLIPPNNKKSNYPNIVLSYPKLNAFYSIAKHICDAVVQVV